jgi:hypothetical protein
MGFTPHRGFESRPLRFLASADRGGVTVCTMTDLGPPPAGKPQPAEPRPLSAGETERVRTRVQLMVEITARSGKYRSGLGAAAKRLTPSEAAIVADLESHGLDVQQLREVLFGAHVLVDAPELYERWRFPKSRERLSSHHKTIDKRQYPDLGLRGPLVREKLHGRTQAGTWVQLEKTPAAMGNGLRLPTVTDLRHLMDYVVYRVTKRNVGPLGLSGVTEKRPMYLSPDLGVTVPLPAAAEAELTGALERIEEDDDDTTSASADLAARFPPPDRADTLAELVFVPGTRAGRGLFGASDVWITETPSPPARELLTRRPEPPRWSLSPASRTKHATLTVGDREIVCAVRQVLPGEEDET